MVDLLNKQQQQHGFHFCCGKLRENNFNKQRWKFNFFNNNNKLYYQIEKLHLMYTHNVFIQKKVLGITEKLI